MLTKQITYDHQITDEGAINVRRITRILEDGVEISKNYHRHVLTPIDNTTDQDDMTKNLAVVAFTDERKAMWQARKDAKDAEQAAALAAAKAEAAAHDLEPE